MDDKVIRAGRLLARLGSVLMWNSFRYPQPVRGRYNMATNPLEKLKWAYRCWVRQTEVAERGSGLEKYFAGQDLHFTLPDEFIPERTITLSAGGDIMAVDVLTPENTENLFDDIAEFYFDADLTCANLESTIFEGAPLGRSQKTGMPARMNTSEAMLDRFMAGGRGVRYLSTANNHCYDYGEEGLCATIDTLDRRGCRYSGTNRTPEEQEDVLVIEVGGLRVAMLAYTFDTNGNAYEKKHLINEVRFNDETCDLALVHRHIARAKAKGADLIVASCHWGWEFEMYPHVNVVEAGHALIEAGVDVILGGHPHVSQPMEKYVHSQAGGPRRGLLFYSLGDFVSYHPLAKNAKLSTVVKFSVSKGTLRGEAKTLVHDLQVLPIYLLARENGGDSYDCRLLKLRTVLGDSPVDGEYTYGLTPEERKDLTRLREDILHGILLPGDFEGILV